MRVLLVSGGKRNIPIKIEDKLSNYEANKFFCLFSKILCNLSAKSRIKQTLNMKIVQECLKSLFEWCWPIVYCSTNYLSTKVKFMCKTCSFCWYLHSMTYNMSKQVLCSDPCVCVLHGSSSLQSCSHIKIWGLSSGPSVMSRINRIIGLVHTA